MLRLPFKALVQIRLGDKEDTLKSLNQSCQRRDRGIISAKFEPRLEPLRGDLRFENFLRRMGF
jgi:hypothetical protein